MSEKLKPCPSCGGPATGGGSIVYCSDRDCQVIGPSGDVNGAKWNALPRRDDPAPGMSDAELITRALLTVAQAIYVGTPPGKHDDLGGMANAATDDLASREDVVYAELNRREALRNPKA